MTSESAPFTLHDFVPAHLPELVDLWVSSWQAAMPAINFEARRDWFLGHLKSLQQADAQVVCAFDRTGALAGFVTIAPATGHLDQLALTPRVWGSTAAAQLLSEAKQRSPMAIELDVNQDNLRAIRFYEKNGFVRTAERVNARSGLKTWHYRWSSA